MKHINQILKSLLRLTYKNLIGLVVIIRTILFMRVDTSPCFCGAIRGSQGGPLVKSNLLMSHFGQNYLNFSLIYTFSGMPYITPTALKFAKNRGFSVIHNQNGVFYEGWYGKGWERQNEEMKSIYSKANLVLFQSKYCEASSKFFLGNPAAESQILYNAVDTSVFFPQRKIDTDNGITFLIAGKTGDRLQRLEGVLYGLAYALKSGLNCKLMIAGPVSERVQERILLLSGNLNLGSRVVFFGKYDRVTAPILFKKADAFITLNYKDSCPNSVLEALASGLPVVYSNTGGTPELVTEECGVGLPCEEMWDKVYYPCSSLIGPAMIKVAENIPTFSRASRMRAVRKFDLACWLNAHEKIFEKFRKERTYGR